jgi:hypothetical protein
MKGAFAQYAYVRLGQDGLPVGHWSDKLPAEGEKNWVRIDEKEHTVAELLEAAEHIRKHTLRSDPFCVHCAKRGETDLEFEERIAAQTVD